MKRDPDWSEWHKRAVAHLATEERPSSLDPESRPPLQPDLLIDCLAAHDVRWVLAGSAVFVMYGAEITPNDLDVVPSTDEANLQRVAEVLGELEAIPAHQPQWRWTLSIDQCCRWRPLPAVETNLDHQFVTRVGVLDIVPSIAGSFDELSKDAAQIYLGPHLVHVTSPPRVASLLGGRPKDEGRATEIDRALRSFETGRTAASPW